LEGNLDLFIGGTPERVASSFEISDEMNLNLFPYWILHYGITVKEVRKGD
jgi:hypothetical protein